MNIKRILIATDFSECSIAALDFASRLASDTGSQLHIVHVDGVVDVGVQAKPEKDSGPYEAPWGHERREVRERLVTTLPTAAHVAHKHHYLTGPPVAQILRMAKQERVDLIVLGSHGRSGFSRLVMGSVAEGVTRGAACPVLIVKHPSEYPAPQDHD